MPIPLFAGPRTATPEEETQDERTQKRHSDDAGAAQNVRKPIRCPRGAKANPNPFVVKKASTATLVHMVRSA